ncbi:MAG: universal stress protein [Candidatus Acidiferrum sp.]
MLTLKKILLPVDFPHTSLPVVHQAATLARHFHSEVLMLHVVTPRSRAAGVPAPGHALAGWNLLEEIFKIARKNKDQILEPDLEGLSIRTQLVEGDPAEAIMESADWQKADLLMLPSHGFTFDQFLVGSVPAKVLYATNCPVWTGGHIQKSPVQKFALRSVLCAIDFRPHNRKTVSWAVQLAAEFGARLTLAHVTAGVESWGPGGDYVNPLWEKELVGDATAQMAHLQKEMGIHADVFIGSGNVPKALSQAAKQTHADLLVTGFQPYGGYLKTHGYDVICALPIPVLSI